MATIFDLLLPVTPMNLLTAFIMVTVFIVVLFLGSKILPGVKGLGEPLKDGSRRQYKLTGLMLFLLATFGAILVLLLYQRVNPWIWNLEYITIRFWSLLIIANIYTVVWTILLFFLGRRKQGEAKRKGFKGVLHDLLSLIIMVIFSPKCGCIKRFGGFIFLLIIYLRSLC